MCVTDVPEGASVTLLVVPGASRDEVVGPHGDALRVRVSAPPEKGRANAAVVELLAERLDARRGDVEIVAGLGARRKTARIRGMDPATVRRRLGI